MRISSKLRCQLASIYYFCVASLIQWNSLLWAAQYLVNCTKPFRNLIHFRSPAWVCLSNYLFYFLNLDSGIQLCSVCIKVIAANYFTLHSLWCVSQNGVKYIRLITFSFSLPDLTVIYLALCLRIYFI